MLLERRLRLLCAMVAIIFLLAGCALLGCGAAATNGASFAACRAGTSF